LFQGILLTGIALALCGPREVGAGSDTVTDGAILFAKNCSVGYCHGKGGSAGRGPRLRGRTFSNRYLYRTIEEGIPASSMGGWKEVLSDAQIGVLVAYIRSLAEPQPALGVISSIGSAAAPTPTTRTPRTPALAGDPILGRELFFESTQNSHNCGTCHQVDGRGGTVGPDLTSLSARSASSILLDIVFPDAVLLDRWQLIELRTVDGEKLEALHVGDSTRRVKVYDVSSSPPVLRAIKKEKIESAKPLQRSAMPADYGERYTLRQLLDLVSYLKTGAGTPVAVTVEDLLPQP
jgi:putative heme-binding domain-containing protein